GAERGGVSLTADFSTRLLLTEYAPQNEEHSGSDREDGQSHSWTEPGREREHDRTDDRERYRQGRQLADSTGRYRIGHEHAKTPAERKRGNDCRGHQHPCGDAHAAACQLSLLLFRHGDRLAALGNDERENFGGLALAGVGGDRVQLAGRLVERLAFGQGLFGAVVELDPVAA